MWKRLFQKHYSYRELCIYLEHKHVLDGKEKKIIEQHIDKCKVCWSTWNRVRWDAAWVKRGTQELAEYLGADFEKYFDSSWALSQDWSAQHPVSKLDIENFYINTPHYMYNSVIFYESGDRHDLRKYLTDLTKKYSIKTVLDYGCGVGNDTLDMLEQGLEVYFADFHSASIDFLRWRLEKRGYKGYFEKHYIDVQAPNINFGGTDLVWTIDVIEHMFDPKDILRYFGKNTKLFLSYIDSSDTDSGRHPFHFPVSCEDLSALLGSVDFRLLSRDGHLCLWEKIKRDEDAYIATQGGVRR